MKYYLIAGEASGDLHASNLMASIKRQDGAAEFRFFGGDLMQSVGGELVVHYRELAYMGFWAVLRHLPSILKNLRFCCADILAYRPDVLILVDYPGFNLKVAQKIKEQCDLPVYYYISPKIWAWKRGRIALFRRYIDRMFSILPFEKAFYKTLDYPIDYVGNPSVDAVASFLEEAPLSSDQFRLTHGLDERPILAILAGSRKAEIRKNLPLMLEVAASFPAFQPVVAASPGLTVEDYLPYLSHDTPSVLFDHTYALLQQSHSAMVTSGTATLETALFRVPQVVCYHVTGGPLVNFVFRHCFYVPYISLVNLIAGRDVVKELFGANFTYRKLSQEMDHLLFQESYRDRIREGYEEVIARLGEAGASDRTALLIVSSLHQEEPVAT